jgi:hypothetical protein
MKELELISIHDLKDAAKELNETGFLAKKLKLVGLSKADMVKNFAYEIEHLTDEQAKELKEKAPKAKEFYEDIFADELGAEKEAKPKKEKKEKEAKPKKEKKEKEAKPKKEKTTLTELSQFGSHKWSQAFIIDTMLLEGGHSLDEITRACATKNRRVANHIQTLKHKKGVNIVRDEHGKYFVKESA